MAALSIESSAGKLPRIGVRPHQRVREAGDPTRTRVDDCVRIDGGRDDPVLRGVATFPHVGGVLRRWDSLEDYTFNTISDAMHEDAGSVEIILRVLSHDSAPYADRRAAMDAFFAAAEKNLVRRCTKALLEAEE
jgi:hypothetical protein